MHHAELYDLLTYARDKELTLSDLHLLCYLDDFNAARLGQVATAIGSTGAAMTGRVDRLVKRGLITRIPDTKDRRSIWLQLTDEGTAIITSVMRPECGRLFTPAVAGHSLKNHPRPADPLGSSQSAQCHPSIPSSGIPDTHPLSGHRPKSGQASRRNTSGRTAVGRTLAILSGQAVQQALAPFWQIDDMRRQLRSLERLHSALPVSGAEASAKARHPLRQALGPAAAPSPHSSQESSSSAHSTTPR